MLGALQIQEYRDQNNSIVPNPKIICAEDTMQESCLHHFLPPNIQVNNKKGDNIIYNIINLR